MPQMCPTCAKPRPEKPTDNQLYCQGHPAAVPGTVVAAGSSPAGGILTLRVGGVPVKSVVITAGAGFEVVYTPFARTIPVQR